MSEVEIVTPRGIRLAGTFVDPVDSTDAAVIFSHSLFSERASGYHFRRLAKMYQAMGYATLKFDYSGHGLSDDDVVTLDAHIEDLKAASAWLTEQGFSRQLLHGHSFGTLPALKGRPPAIQTMILSGAITGPLSFDWERIFSPDQLDELDKTGLITIRDDSEGPRQQFVISAKVLQDMSLNSPEELVGELDYPVLLIHDVDDEQKGLLQLTTESFHRLPDGSRVEAVPEASFGRGESLDRLAEVTAAWARQYLPVR